MKYFGSEDHNPVGGSPNQRLKNNVHVSTPTYRARTDYMTSTTPITTTTTTPKQQVDVKWESGQDYGVPQSHQFSAFTNSEPIPIQPCVPLCPDTLNFIPPNNDNNHHHTDSSTFQTEGSSFQL
ncbi:hypothetical protein Pmani_028729 [Petrolisthes manimaculis]|uniref:Uncharacterized protein n=1 Tax=Petrolisthes manimaculis TaxID=1843537 RepID=A0AAE1NYZ3_9EUCA|nr:hypothetical protein Pmani_028729 [Petrolisthes manimaculis]